LQTILTKLQLHLTCNIFAEFEKIITKLELHFRCHLLQFYSQCRCS